MRFDLVLGWSLCLPIGAGLAAASAQEEKPAAAPASGPAQGTAPAPGVPAATPVGTVPATAPTTKDTPMGAVPPAANAPAEGTPAAPASAGSAAAVPPVPHSVLFRFYDKDGNQVLSREELEKLPLPMREWIAKQKIDTEAGLTKEAFETAAPKLVEHLRARTAETVLAPVPLPTVSSDPGSSSGRSSRGGSGSSDFHAIDLDHDSQLSFREWRAGKRLAAEFGPRDVNGDGVVTSAEFEQTKGLAMTVVSSSSSRTVTNSSTPGSPPSNPPGPPGSPPMAPPGFLPKTPPTIGPASSPGGSSLGTIVSRQVFESLDKNKDGKINPDEWSGSRRTGPGFKEKGIDISTDMSREDFHANYAKAFPPR